MKCTSKCCFYQLWIICSDQTFKEKIAIRQIDVIFTFLEQNCTNTNMMHTFCLSHQDRDDGICMLLFAVREAFQESLGFSPLHLFWTLRGRTYNWILIWLSCFRKTHYSQTKIVRAFIIVLALIFLSGMAIEKRVAIYIFPYDSSMTEHLGVNKASNGLLAHFY
jgi:hypothetical protein